MQVILLERVEKLGQMGEVVNVKPGYARNFLLPSRKALRATKDNLALFETQRMQLEADNLKRRDEAEKVAKDLDGLKVVIIRSAGDSGQLYGSVNARDIADAVTGGGFRIARNQVVLDRPVKSLGLFDLRVKLHPEVASTITANVARSDEEALEQDRLGRAVLSAEAEEAAAAEEEAAAAAAAAAAMFEPEAAEQAKEAAAGLQDGSESGDDDGDGDTRKDANAEEGSSTEAIDSDNKSE